MMFSKYTFQESKIFEGSKDSVDPTRDPVTISAKSEAKARRNLPDTTLGRHWILTSVEPKVVK